MGRDLKFRAWDKNTSEWLYAELTTHSSLNTTRLIHSSEWLQYTGLKDKNGVDIYEGDIVERQKIARGRKNGTVKWIVEWQLDQTHNGWNVWETTKDQIEVIGNIYENNELIKGESE